MGPEKPISLNLWGDIDFNIHTTGTTGSETVHLIEVIKLFILDVNEYCPSNFLLPPPVLNDHSLNQIHLCVVLEKR